MPDHQRILEVVEDNGLLAALHMFDPCIVGTLAIGLAVDGSDIDIVCETHDADDFRERLATAFGHHGQFGLAVRHDRRPWRVVARFEVEGWPVEVFGEPRPVVLQAAYRHMVIQHRLLDLGGSALRAAVMRRRHGGAKTEPAFASALGLEGDPYSALLELESLSDSQLLALIAANL